MADALAWLGTVLDFVAALSDSRPGINCPRLSPGTIREALGKMLQASGMTGRSRAVRGQLHVAENGL